MYALLGHKEPWVPKWQIRGVEENLLRAFLHHIPDGVYFKDCESRFVLISRSLAIRFGLSDPSEAINKTDFDMFSEAHAKQAFADERETWPDGRETWVLTTKLPLIDDQGSVIGTMGISRDITERKHVEQELREYRVRLEGLVAERTAELVQANAELERDIAARKVVEEALALKAQELVRSNAVLENLSLIDDLTGLYNRKGFFALAEHRVKLAYRTGEPFSIAFVDLDGLKRIKGTVGHQEGDRALSDAANVLRESLRESDILARLGGDEFAIFIAEAQESRIVSIKGRIQQKLDSWNAEAGRKFHLSFSMGIVSGVGRENSDVDTLLELADTLMYQHKSSRQFSRRNAEKRSPR